VGASERGLEGAAAGEGGFEAAAAGLGVAVALAELLHERGPGGRGRGAGREVVAEAGLEVVDLGAVRREPLGAAEAAGGEVAQAGGVAEPGEHRAGGTGEDAGGAPEFAPGAGPGALGRVEGGEALAGAGEREAGTLGRVGEGCLLGQAVRAAAELIGELVDVGEGALEAAGEGAAVGDTSRGGLGGAEEVALVGAGAGEELLADQLPGLVAALAGLGEAGRVGQGLTGEQGGELGFNAGELGGLLGQVIEGVTALAFAVEVARLHVLDGGEAGEREAVEGVGGGARVEAGEGLLELGVDAKKVDLAALELGVGGLRGLELGEQAGAALVGCLVGEDGRLDAETGEFGLVVGFAAGEDL
jgi:hypothetical protein